MGQVSSEWDTRSNYHKVTGTQWLCTARCSTRAKKWVWTNSFEWSRFSLSSMSRVIWPSVWIHPTRTRIKRQPSYLLWNSSSFTSTSWKKKSISRRKQPLQVEKPKHPSAVFPSCSESARVNDFRFSSKERLSRARENVEALSKECVWLKSKVQKLQEAKVVFTGKLERERLLEVKTKECLRLQAELQVT